MAKPPKSTLSWNTRQQCDCIEWLSGSLDQKLDLTTYWIHIEAATWNNDIQFITNAAKWTFLSFLQCRWKRYVRKYCTSNAITFHYNNMYRMFISKWTQWNWAIKWKPKQTQIWYWLLNSNCKNTKCIYNMASVLRLQKPKPWRKSQAIIWILLTFCVRKYKL